MDEVMSRSSTASFLLLIVVFVYTQFPASAQNVILPDPDAEGITITAPENHRLAGLRYGPIPEFDSGNPASELPIPDMGLTIVLQGNQANNSNIPDDENQTVGPRGVRLYGPAVPAGTGRVVVQCMVRTTGPGVALTLGALNVPPENAETQTFGSLATNQTADGAAFLNAWKTLEVLYDPLDDTIVPVFQAVSTSEKVTTVYIGPIVVRPFEGETETQAKNTGTASSTLAQKSAEPAALTQETPTPTSTPSPILSPTITYTPTVTRTPTPTFTPTLTPTPRIRFELSHTLGLGTLNGVACAPDGKTFLTWGGAGAFLWDAQTYTLLGAFAGHTSPVNAAAYSPDSNWVLTGSEDGTARLWDAGIEQLDLKVEHADAQENLLYTFTLQAPVTSLAFSPDGSLLLAGTSGTDNSAWIWSRTQDGDNTEWTLQRKLAGHTKGVQAIAVSENGGQILTGGLDKSARLWSSGTDPEVEMRADPENHQIYNFQGHAHAIYAVAFAPDSQTLLTGGRDGQIRYWNSLTGKLIRIFQAHDTATGLRDMAFSPNGFQLATAGFDNTVKLWEFASRKLIHTFIGHTEWVHSVSFSADGLYLFSGGFDQLVKVWDTTLTYHPPAETESTAKAAPLEDEVEEPVTDEFLVTEINLHTDNISSVIFSKDGNWILTGNLDKKAKLWSATNYRHSQPQDIEFNDEERLGIYGRPVSATTELHTGWVFGAALSPDGHQVITGSYDRSAKLWETATGELLRTLQGHRGSVRAVQFMHKTQRAVTASWDGRAKLWDVSSATSLRVVARHEQPIYAIDIAWNDTKLITGDLGGEAAIWSMSGTDEPAEPLLTLKGHSDWIHSVAFSRDGALALTGSRDGTAILWDAGTGQRYRTFYPRRGAVISVAFSPHGTEILTATEDGTATLWDIDSFQILLRVQWPSASVPHVAFAPDGMQFAMGAADGLTYVWNVIRPEPPVVDPEEPTPTPDENVTPTITPTPSPDPGDVYQYFGLGSLLCAAFSSDRSTVATAGSAGAYLWRVEDERILRSFSGHRAPIRTLDLSVDASRLLTADDTGEIKLWDTKTGAVLMRFPNHTRRINDVVLSPDGMHIAACSDDMTVTIWRIEADPGNNGADTPTGTLLHQLKSHSDIVQSLAFSPDGNVLASGGGSWDRTVRLWNVQQGTLVRNLVGLGGSVRALAFSPDGKRLATGGGDHIARIWDLDTGQLMGELQGHTSYIVAIAFSSDGKQLLTGGVHRTAKLWNIEGIAPNESESVNTRRLLETYFGHTQSVHAVGFARFGTQVLTASADGTIAFWNTSDGEQELILTGHAAGHGGYGVHALSVDSDGVHVMTGGEDGTAKLWEIYQPSTDDSSELQDEEFILATLKRTLTGHDAPVQGVAIQGNIMVTGGADHNLKVWDPERSLAGKTLELEGTSGSIRSIALAADGNRVLTGCYDNVARLWSIDDEGVIKTYRGHTGPVWAVALSPTGGAALTGSEDQTAMYWTAGGSEPKFILTGHAGAVQAVAVSKNGKMLLTGSYDGTAKLWDAETGLILRNYVGHSGPIWSVAFSPDGKTILTGSHDQTARLWETPLADEDDTDTGSGDDGGSGEDPGDEVGYVKQIFAGHAGAIRAVAYTTDGKKVITASWDGSARMWEIEDL